MCHDNDVLYDKESGQCVASMVVCTMNKDFSVPRHGPPHLCHIADYAEMEEG